MPGQQAAKKQKVRSRGVLIVILLGLLMYVAIPQLHEFNRSIHLLQDANVSAIVTAIFVSFGAHAMAATKYNVLAFKPLNFIRTLLVQVAGLLTNRLLPAGIGGIGINYIYLRKERHTASQAAAVLTMNNILGLVGHGLLVIALLATGRMPAAHLPGLHLKIDIALIIVGLGVAVLLWLSWRKIQRGLVSLLQSLGSYRKRPADVAVAIICSAGLAVFYALCLWYSATALHVSISFMSALIVLTVGVAASTVTPTPGGLIGVEAALVAGLIAYNVTPAAALAVALLYRFITYWFSLLLGGVAFVVCERKGII